MENSEGFTHLIVESDSKLLIDMVIGSCKLNRHTPILVHCIQDLAILYDNIGFKHTWHGENRCADWLTHFRFNQSSYDVRILESPPRKLQNLLLMTCPELTCQRML